MGRIRYHDSVQQMTALPTGGALAMLELSFFVPKTKSRAERLNKMVKELKLTEEQHGRHVLAADFLPIDSEKFFAFVHIDEFSSKSERAKSYFVQFRLRPRPKHPPPKAVKERGKRLDWAVAELKALAGNSPGLCFIEAEVTIPNAPPPPMIAIPITFGTQTLPIKGVQYGADTTSGDEGISEFRWTRDGKGLIVEISYTRQFAAAMLADAWTNEATRVGKYVKEGLGQ